MYDRIFILAFCIFTSPEPDFKVLQSSVASQGGLSLTKLRIWSFSLLPKTVSQEYEKVLYPTIPLFFPQVQMGPSLK